MTIGLINLATAIGISIWFQVGVAVQNDSDRRPIAVSVEVEGVRVYEVSNMR